ncbi:cyclic nucleotide-binding domain-containing protein [Terasakiella sp. SH-1]|uniref:cyclic nucleotide-binding domain-containing protein n=1 Tax=Terasakiella sp. SH-1 TaxID=2560057 RepID=UPI001073951B|nr:cyclic nucleotide-binding domain-containing protein [Terasakiella sp. SH-1]
MSDGGTIKKFSNGEVIFKEGTPSDAAYVIVKGAVELTKDSKHGPVRLANLKAGELFGEMGVIDGSPRSATARAIGATTVKEIQPDLLLKGIQNDPELSSKVMGKLVERLRTADEMLAKAGVSPADGAMARPAVAKPPAPAATSPAPKKKGFFARLFNSDKGREATYEILVADFFDDDSNNVTNTFYNALKTKAEQVGGGLINVRKTGSAFAVSDFSDTPMIWGQVKSNAQRWLKELEGDLLVWGEVRARGQTAHLRMAQLHPFRHERAGNIKPCDAIDLPVDLDDELKGYLYGVVIGAMVPGTREQHDSFEGILGPALNGAGDAMHQPLRDLDDEEHIRFEMGYANLQATCATYTRNADYFKAAEESYIKAQRGLRRSNSVMLEGIIKRHLGYCQSAWYDLGGEKNLLEAAIESLRAACTHFHRDNFANDWADLQSSIGQLLFKKDAIDDDDKALRESIAAFQNALQIFTASTTPQRWGEAKHHLARALQLLGSQSDDLEMIARSAEACREALAVRSKKQTPMLWAATQNNLGSALFMLCQRTKKPETAEAATKAFEAALEVYEARKATKLAQVTQNNLHRAQAAALNLGPAEQSPSEDNDSFSEDAFDHDDEPHPS